MAEVRWRRKRLHEIAVRFNVVELQIFQLDPKGQRLLLHERNNTVKAQDIAVVELLSRLAALFFPFLYRSQGIFFDEPAQVEQIVLKFLLVLHPCLCLSCNMPRMISNTVVNTTG
jgi:hypothetical protein